MHNGILNKFSFIFYSPQTKTFNNCSNITGLVLFLLYGFGQSGLLVCCTMSLIVITNKHDIHM